MPEGACDTHVHVFGPSSVFPYAKDAPFVPHDAPKEKLFAMHAALGMHLQVHFESSLIHELAPWLRKSAVPVVIDHMARVDASKGLDQPDFRALLELMQDSRFLVKVSGSERCTRQAPPYGDAIPYAAKLVAEFGGRTLWGTDWPHPNLNHVPDDGLLADLLADLLAEIALTAAQRQTLLVDNPRRFYRF